MKFIVEAYDIEYVGGIFVPHKDKIHAVEIEVEATDENEAIGKARQMVREREYFEVIKVRS
jgi:hypothetical protein